MASSDQHAQQAWARLRYVLRKTIDTKSATLDEHILRDMGVDLSSLNIATGESSDGGPRFMTPFSAEEYIRLQDACEDPDRRKTEDDTFEPLGWNDPTWKEIFKDEDPDHDIRSHGNASEVLYHVLNSAWLMHRYTRFSEWTYDSLCNAFG